MELQINKVYKDLLPRLTSDQITSLTDDIKQNGILNPIIIWNDVIIDGHHRYEIAQKLCLDYIPTYEMSFNDEAEATSWMIQSQIHRRNLTPKQLSEFRAKRYEMLKKDVGGAQKGNSHASKNIGAKSAPMKKTAEIVAEEFGVSERTIMNDVKKYRTKDMDTKEMEIPEVKEDTQEGRILKYVQYKDGATKPEVAEHFNIPMDSAGRALSNLKNKHFQLDTKGKRDGQAIYAPSGDREITLDVSEDELKKNFKWIPKTKAEVIVFNVENGGCVVITPEYYGSDEFQEVFKRRHLTQDRNVEMISLHHHMATNPYNEENDVKHFQCYKHWLRHKPTITRAVREWHSKIIVDGYFYPAGQYLIDTYITKND